VQPVVAQFQLIDCQVIGIWQTVSAQLKRLAFLAIWQPVAAKLDWFPNTEQLGWQAAGRSGKTDDTGSGCEMKNQENPIAWKVL
jgi:hypothetical protein